MTASTRLERELTDWLSETAMPQTPDYADDILDETSRIRQRPRWSFVGRWLPVENVSRIAPVAGSTAVRGLALIVLMALLLVAIATFVGSRRSVPPPFGPAGNGLLAYDQAGAIFLVHPDTLTSQRIVGGSGVHHFPRWSLDGTRLAFVRETTAGQVLVVSDKAGRVITGSEPFRDVDSDSIVWSPDGRYVAIGANGKLGRAIYLVDTSTGTLRDLGVEYDNFEMYWRPPDGRELLFHTNGTDPGLSIVSLQDGTVRSVTPREIETSSLRPQGWTPDGRAILYQKPIGPDSERTFVVDVQTGEERMLDVMYGHVSNDGARVVGLDAFAFARPCVVAVTGGRCETVPNAPEWVGTTSAAVTWSPDDRLIAMFGLDEASIWIVDPTGAVPPRQVASKSPASWQRIAP